MLDLQPDFPGAQREAEGLDLQRVQVDMACEVGATISLRSEMLLYRIMMKVQEMLEFHFLTAGQDHIEGTPISPLVKYANIRADVESSLGFAYGVVGNLRDVQLFRENQDLLFQRSEKRFRGLGSQTGVVKLDFYAGTLAYHHGALAAIKDGDPEEIRRHLATGVEKLTAAIEGATEYRAIYDVLATYNLGRTQFALGNVEEAEQVFRDCLRKGRELENRTLMSLSRHHLDSLDDACFGAVLADPRQFTYVTTRYQEGMQRSALGESPWETIERLERE